MGHREVTTGEPQILGDKNENLRGAIVPEIEPAGPLSRMYRGIANTITADILDLLAGVRLRLNGVFYFL
jgi:hypothetical protein